MAPAMLSKLCRAAYSQKMDNGDFAESVTTSSLFHCLSAFPTLSYDMASTIPLQDNRGNPELSNRTLISLEGRSFGQGDVFMNRTECPFRVIHLNFRVSHMNETHHRLLLLSDEGDIIPHFSLHLAVGSVWVFVFEVSLQEIGARFALSLDLIPRIPDFDKFPSYGERLYEGLARHKERLHSLQSCKVAPVLPSIVPASPHAISMFFDRDDADPVRAAIQGFLTHWLFIANGERRDETLNAAVDIMDLRLRSIILCPRGRLHPIFAQIIAISCSQSDFSK